MNIADIIGVLGFALAVGLAIREIYKERPKLKITFSIDEADYSYLKTIGDIKYSVTPMYLYIYLSNIGEKPIAVSKIYFYEYFSWFRRKHKTNGDNIHSLANDGDEEYSLPPFEVLPQRRYLITFNAEHLTKHLKLSTKKQSTKIFIKVTDETFRDYRSKKFKVNYEDLRKEKQYKIPNEKTDPTPIQK